MIGAASLLMIMDISASDLPDAEVDYVVSRFREACMHGQATFGPGQVKAIQPKDLHSDVRWSYGHIDDAKYYQLTLSKPAYLVVWDHKPQGEYYTKGCAVVAQGLPFAPTWEKVLNTRFSATQRSRFIEVETRYGQVEFPLPEEGKKLYVGRIGTFVKLQVATMSKEETGDWKLRQSIKRNPVNSRK
ncbi:hypothetical protein [Sphingomonas antarctica]|uniref:hypothetical protein n=1 Tax=Sphingomonas antarctica TaxID=2040274 RepID=UPI0039EBBFD2